MKKSQARRGQIIRKPYRIRKKKSILKNRFFWYVILFLILSAAVFYFLIFSSFFQIKEIIISGEKKNSKEDVKQGVEKEIEKKLLFFPTKSIFLVSSQKIREGILDNFPAISEIEIRRGFPDALNITIIERREIAAFCREERCFLLDNAGVIFEEAAQNWLGVLKVENPSLDKELKIRDRVIEKEKLGKILEIVSKLKEIPKLQVNSAEIISEERLNIKTSEGWEIYFNPAEDINWQIEELALVLEKKILPEKREELEYIDLRFSRVYYRFR